MTKLVSENQHTELGGRFPAYDGRDSLFTAGALPFGTKEFEVTLSAGGDKRMDRKYKVVINHATAVSLLQLRMLLAGYPTDIPAQALQVLETVLGDVLLNERDIERVPIGTNGHTLGVEAWKGLYQSIRSTQDGLSLIADVSSSVFVQPLLLIDFVQKTLKIDIVDRNLTEPEYDKLLKAIRGVKIEVTHRGNKRRRYRITSLSVKPTNDLSFESTSGATKTVIDHFRERFAR
ncbi:protein argonaute 1C-like isoform X2 [Miscanthus floridulus]|uniref:protein argonaute 1C-like isoform X2 n=1 Tax=Miscanthus floridulus TaxID=154761 RepID=UPI00345ABE47